LYTLKNKKVKTLLKNVPKFYKTNFYVSFSGPPVAEKKEMKRIVRLGSDVKLICPVSAFPAPMFEWYKDGEVINNYAWARYRFQLVCLSF
jgi:hypothetical protein